MIATVATKAGDSGFPTEIDSGLAHMLGDILSAPPLSLTRERLSLARIPRKRFGPFGVSAEIGARNSQLRLRVGLFYDATPEGLAAPHQRRENIHDCFGEIANQLIGKICSAADDGRERLQISPPNSIFWGDDEFAVARTAGSDAAAVTTWMISHPARVRPLGLMIMAHDHAQAINRWARMGAKPIASGEVDFF